VLLLLLLGVIAAPCAAAEALQVHEMLLLLLVLGAGRGCTAAGQHMSVAAVVALQGGGQAAGDWHQWYGVKQQQHI
jgi:hypothetical protein